MSTYYVIQPNISFRQVNDELFLLHRNESTVFNLNPTATFIWNKIANGESTDTIINCLCKEYAIDQDTARNDVMELIDTLQQKNMVEPR